MYFKSSSASGTGATSMCQFLIGIVFLSLQTISKNRVKCQFLIGNVFHKLEGIYEENFYEMCQFLIGNVFLVENIMNKTQAQIVSIPHR